MNIWVKLMKHLLCNTIKEPANLNEYEKQRLQTTLTLTYTKIHRLLLGFPETVSLLQPHNKCSLFVWHPGEPLEPRKMKYTVEIVLPFFNQFGTTTSVIFPRWWWPLVTIGDHSSCQLHVLFQWWHGGMAYHDYYETNPAWVWWRSHKWGQVSLSPKIRTFLRFWTTAYYSYNLGSISKYSKKNNTRKYSE